MSPMLDVQRRQATTYRIRFGTKTGNRPVKLTDAIRVTADNPDTIDAFIEVYGGERREWKPDEHRNEWEAFLPTTQMEIVLIPGQSLSQWWELWRGSVCERRCDGNLETKSGRNCVCPARDPADRTAAKGQCNPVTRVHVICPGVRVIGAGMFVINGLIGAETLPDSIRNAHAALAAGLFVPATLSVVEHRGRNHFIVPRIDIHGISMYDMLEASQAKAEGGAIDLASRHVLGGLHQNFKPIAELGTGSVRDQMGTVDDTTPPPRRKNAAEPIPPTDAPIRTAADAEQPNYIDADSYEDGDEPGDHERDGVNRIAIACREAGLDDDGRHLLCEWASNGSTSSSKALDDTATGRAYDALAMIKAGQARLDRQDGTAVLLHKVFGWKTEPPAVGGDATPPVSSPAAGPPPGVGRYTLEQIEGMGGRELADALIELKLSPAGSVPDLRTRLMEACDVGEEPF